MRTVAAKTIITRTSSPQQWFGCHYNMNLYRGCSHGCIYCDSRSSCYQVECFDEVSVKQNALDIVARELVSKRKPGVVGTGAMSDPYNPLEGELQLTRGALKLILEHHFGIHLITKGVMVTRDIELLQAISKGYQADVCVTITTPDDKLAAIIEPNAPSSSDRFKALEALAKAGIYCGITLMPLLPWITDSTEHIRLLIRKAADSGVNFIHPWLGMSLRKGQREYFYRMLDQHWPGLRKRYEEVYGDSYGCDVPNVSMLWEVFASECRRFGIIWKMDDIINGAKNWSQPQQLSLF